MIRMRSALRSTLAPALLLVLAAGASHAAPPAALDVVPASPAVVVIIRSMESFDAKFRQLGAALPAAQGMLPGEALAGPRKIMNAPGVDPKGSFAIVVLDLPEGDAAAVAKDKGLLVLPVTDYAAFVTAASGNATEGVTKLATPQGDFFAKNLGNGFALLGSSQEQVTSAAFKPGAAASHVKSMGALATVADTADALILASPQMASRVTERQGSNGLTKRLMGGDGGMAQPENPAVDPEKQAGEAAKQFAKVIAEQGQLGVMALTMGESGVSIDAGLQFKEGTTAAVLLNQNGDSAALMSRLPSQAFYMAAAADLSSPGVQLVLAQMRGNGADKPPQGAGALLSPFFSQLAKSDGFAVCIGQSAGGVLGGTLFSNTIGFTRCKDPAAAIAALRESQQQAGGTKVGGVTMKTEYQADQPLKDMPEQKFDSWTTTFEFDPADEEAGQLEFAMGMIMGGNSMTNMASPVDAGIYYTMSKNSRLMRNAVNSGKSGQGQNTDPLFAKAQAGLPPKRAMEMYLGVRPVMEAIRDAMMLEEADLPMPAGAPPVAVSATTDAGSLGLRLFVPTESMEAISKTMNVLRPGGIGQDKQAPAREEPAKPQV